MKRKHVLIVFVLYILTGCSNLDLNVSDIKIATDSGEKITFSAVINEQDASDLANTKATETNWEEDDTVGITCGTTQINIQYAYSGDSNTGLFEAVGGTAEDIWVLGTETYDVTAYYPFTGTSGQAPSTISVKTDSEVQATKESRAKIDYLFASGTASFGNSNVQLAFNHKMSRIKLTFTAGEGVTLSDITCYLINLKTTGTFNPNTGVASANEDATVEDIYWTKIGKDINYVIEAILLPQTITNTVYIQAGMDGYYYEAQFPNLKELVSGTSYNYTIQVNKYTDNTYYLTVQDASTSIIGWTNEDNGTTEADANLAGTGTTTTDSSWSPEEEDITPTVK